MREREELWSERAEGSNVRERDKEREMSCETGREKEREKKYYFNEKESKIIFFLFSSHEQCTSIYRCAL